MATIKKFFFLHIRIGIIFRYKCMKAKRNDLCHVRYGHGSYGISLHQIEELV